MSGACCSLGLAGWIFRRAKAGASVLYVLIVWESLCALVCASGQSSVGVDLYALRCGVFV